MTITGKFQAKLLRLAFGEQWVIGARPCSGPHPDAGIAGCTLLEPPAGEQYADPFVINVGKTTYVLFESWGGRNPKGVIQFATLDRDGRWSEPEVALQRPYHLSYPFVFSWRGDFHLLPETHHNKTIELYRATEFPRRWELAAVLMDRVDAVDTTLFEYQGRWWMFTAGLGDSRARFRQLSLFYASSPFGPWVPHALNPVINDLGGARPAGRLYVNNGQLIRPSQDCRFRYGYAISWNRVDQLNEREYHETCLSKLKPKYTAGWLATHTFNQDGCWQVFDGKRVTRSLGRELGCHSADTTHED